MSARHTIKDMQLLASHKGGKCLSKDYWNARTKLTWMCAKGHTWDATPDHILRQGSWCPVCWGNKKGTIEQMHLIAMERKGKCLSKIYVNSNFKLKWQCIKGHIWMAVPSSIKSGSWCPYCFGAVRKTIEQMQQFAKEKKGKCLSKKYINQATPLKWQCAQGHVWKARPGDITWAKTWCPVCFRRKKAGSKPGKHTIEEMHRVAKEKKGKCLSSKYINIHTKLKWQCARRHVWNATPASVFHNRSWCAICRNSIDRSTKHIFHIKE